ncbi:hypothetical protein PENTCL1PPCAC_19808, partial [Pristionchus entomophagus]
LLQLEDFRFQRLTVSIGLNQRLNQLVHFRLVSPAAFALSSSSSLLLPRIDRFLADVATALGRDLLLQFEDSRLQRLTVCERLSQLVDS